MGEGRNRTVPECKAGVLAERVEAVLRRHTQRYPRQRSGELAVDVCVHQMRVENRRSPARQIPGKAQERERVDISGQRNRVERYAATLQLARKLPRPRLVL